MGTAPAFASVSEALDMVRAGLGFLAAADATELTAAEQAECLRALERANSAVDGGAGLGPGRVHRRAGLCRRTRTTARGSWLIHQTGITRGAAVVATRAWAKRAATHPRVLRGAGRRGRCRSRSGG